MDTRATSRPTEATRQIETTAGPLNYQELAPLLATRVSAAEAALLAQQFAAIPIHVDFVHGALLMNLRGRILP